MSGAGDPLGKDGHSTHKLLKSSAHVSYTSVQGPTTERWRSTVASVASNKCIKVSSKVSWELLLLWR